MGKTKPAVNDEPPVQAESPANVLFVPLSRLVIDERNVRFDAGNADEEIFKLIASIESVGLLQPLVVIAAGNDWSVVAGRRRLLALQAIHQDKHPHQLVECIEVPESVACEASLAENYARRQMSTAELYLGFKAMGTDDPDVIATAFGLPIDRVKRILRLSNLAPPVMAAWSAGELTDQKAQAFASTEDQEVQALVFEQFNQWDSATDIRRRIRELISGNIDLRLLRFVGQEDYVKAGGKFEADLFTDEITPLDGPLLAKLADDKLELFKAEWERDTVRAGSDQLNIEWVSERPVYDYRLQVRFELVHETEADSIRAAEVDTNLENWDQELEEMEVDQYCDFDDDGLLVEEERARRGEDDVKRIHEIKALMKEAEAEKDALDKKLKRRIPEGKGLVQIFAYINGDRVSTEEQYATLEDAGIEDKDESKSSSPKATEPKTQVDADKADTGASRHAFMTMQIMFADRVALEGEADAEAGGNTSLAMLLFTIARTYAPLEHTYGINRERVGLPAIRTSLRGGSATQDFAKAQEGPAFERLREFNWMKEESLVRAWDLFLAWLYEEPTKRLGELGAMLLGLVWGALGNEYAEADSPLPVQLLAEALDPGPTEWAQRFDRERLLNLMSHKARCQTIDSWGLYVHSKGLKKADSTAVTMKFLGGDPEMDKLWSIDLETRADIDGWLPAPCQIKPVKRPEAKKVKAKKAKAKKGE